MEDREKRNKRGPRRPPGETRAAVQRLRAEGKTANRMARELGVSKGTVAYHLRRLDIEPDPRFARRYDWTLRAVYDSGVSLTECRRRFGFSADSWVDAIKRGDVVPRPRSMPIENLLVVGRRTGRTHLKDRLLGAGLKRNLCERCGINVWLGEPLTMHLHHVNGDGTDNRLENLQLLCPNCHSQTDTYGGRNGHSRRGVGVSHA